MLELGNTLHFINRVDETNCGDSMVTPLIYYYEYFKQYNIKRHDIRFVDFKSINPSDVVILGGGGLFDYSETLNRNINKVLDICSNVIAWSPGFNTHDEYEQTFKTQINFDKFKLLNVRDINNKYNIKYLPDITCKLPQLQKSYEIKRKYGIARHKDYPIENFNYETILNNENIDNIIKFIGESEIILSNSFHMIYWSILMGKKTICVNPFSTKFHNYKYAPSYYNNDSDFSQFVNDSKNYDVLDECIKQTDEFFQKAKRIIEKNLSPSENNWYKYEAETHHAVLEQKIRENNLQYGDGFGSQLFIDTGDGFSEQQKEITIINVYGDNIHKLTFDLSKYKDISNLRFDPIEGVNCEIEILSAKTDLEECELIPNAAIKVNNADRFFITDPQYLIHNPKGKILNIEFTFRVLPRFEVEQAVLKFISNSNNRVESVVNELNQKNNYICEKEQEISRQKELIAQKDRETAELNQIIVSKNTEITECKEKIQTQEQSIKEINKHLCNYKQEIETKQNIINEQEFNIRKLEVDLYEEKSRVKDYFDIIQTKEEQIFSLKKDLDFKQTQLDIVYNSGCWKITAPYRKTADAIRHLKKGKG